MAKVCKFCGVELGWKYTKSLCEKCQTLRESFQCLPPESCFRCPFPDCIASTHAHSTYEEAEYLKCAGFVERRRR